MKSSFFRAPLNWIYENFKKDTSKMLVVTGTLGWALSSLAQMGAILFNPKIDFDQKSFLLPQEFLDAVFNVGAFFAITTLTKKSISKLASTGKIAPKKVREFLHKNKDLYGDKVGKYDFDLDEVLKKDAKFPKDSYYTYKNYVTTVGTVGASILSCNIVTPILSNSLAADVQKEYFTKKKNLPKSQQITPINYSSGMRI